MVSISVIVPIYKVELYVEKCIHSLLAQTFNNFEIILIDDCSPDQSIHLAKNILESQSRITYRVICKEVNEGLSAARNTGIENSNGKYLFFIDSDDWIEKETLQKLYESAVSTESGMVICRVRQVYDDNITSPYILKSLPAGTLNGKLALIKLFNGEFFAHIWKILFIKSRFDTIRFPKGIVYEDMLTLPYLLINEEKVCFIDDILCNYLQRTGSITKSYNHNIMTVFHKVCRMENDLEPLLNNSQKIFLIRYTYLLYLTLCHHVSSLSPSYEKAEEVLLACRKNIKITDLFDQLKQQPSRSMLAVLLLKISPYRYFKRNSFSIVE
jgi:glycosyltransferase involved in cell wall biosynthesis